MSTESQEPTPGRMRKPRARLPKMAAEIKAVEVEMQPHAVVAKRLGLTPTRLLYHVSKGNFPLPKFILGTMRMYPKAWIDQKIATGTWPKGVRFK